MIIPKYLNDNDTLGVTACSCGVLKKLPKYEKSINNRCIQLRMSYFFTNFEHLPWLRVAAHVFVPSDAALCDVFVPSNICLGYGLQPMFLYLRTPPSYGIPPKVLPPYAAHTTSSLTKYAQKKWLTPYHPTFSTSLSSELE